jgi:hypothetical protein
MINLIVLLVLVGVGLYLMQLIPMDPVIKQILRVVIIFVAVLFALQALGLWSGTPAGLSRHADDLGVLPPTGCQPRGASAATCQLRATAPPHCRAAATHGLQSLWRPA